MRKILLFPCLLISHYAICQTHQKLEDIIKNPEHNKSTKVLSQPLHSKGTVKNKVITYKKIDKKLTASKPTDHLLDIKNEPE